VRLGLALLKASDRTACPEPVEFVSPLQNILLSQRTMEAVRRAAFMVCIRVVPGRYVPSPYSQIPEPFGSTPLDQGV